MPRYSDQFPYPADAPPEREADRLSHALIAFVFLCIGAALPLAVLYVSPRLLLGDSCAPAITGPAATPIAR